MFAENDVDAAVMAYVQEQLKAGDGFAAGIYSAADHGGFVLSLASVEAERKLTQQRTRFWVGVPTGVASGWKILAVDALRIEAGIGPLQATEIVDGKRPFEANRHGEPVLAEKAAAALEAHGCRIKWEP